MTNRSRHFKNAILDGELVCLDQDGRSQFQELMHRRRQDAAFYAFDLLCLDGEDLRGLPLLDRKQRLQRLLKGQPGLLYAAHVERHCVRLFETVCRKTWRASLPNIGSRGIPPSHKDGSKF